jgi:hypothetical protein
VTFILGRDRDDGPKGHLGHYRARDGSQGAPIYVDVDDPHAALVVGKRGYGKSHTLGVFAEALARAAGVAPVVVDPMGVFSSMAEAAPDPAHGRVPAEIVSEPAVSPDAVDPRSWCALVGLSPDSGAGALLWQAAASASSLSGMRAHVAAADAPDTVTRAAGNHLRLAASWDVFDPEGLDASELATSAATVVDLSEMERAPANAVLRAVAEELYAARAREQIERLPWLLVDEAHVFFDGVAADALRAILTRGRGHGVSLVAATQRPGAIPAVGRSQSDLIVAHRLTAQSDIDALEALQPTYVDGRLLERLPTDPGDVVVLDDTTETVHAARVRTRHSLHDGDSPRASEVVASAPTHL